MSTYRLLLCDFCPAAYHPECLGLSEEDVPSMSWSCPHHSCLTCERKASAVGGLLFRCEVCPTAYCDDHLPQQLLSSLSQDSAKVARHGSRPKARLLGESELFQSTGASHPAQACYFVCSDACAKDRERLYKEVLRKKSQPRLSVYERRRRAIENAKYEAASE